jgi:type IV pilus assembly protein PilB
MLHHDKNSNAKQTDLITIAQHFIRHSVLDEVAAVEPLIDFVNQLIQEALRKNASDIHIEPYEKMSRIRFRQDGLLHEIMEIPPILALRLATRLKILAQLDIAEKRLPQDGRLQHYHHKMIDIRLNTCPTLYGEKIVLRLLDTHKIALAIDQLGMTKEQLTVCIDKIQQPQGFILVTGPTGSGKTITLYSILQYLNQVEKNISTVEDPIEISLPGINQIPIHTKIGLNFGPILRTLLRQDPDIIMIGETRDPETASMAIDAAQTGHLVLSTLHTNNALEAMHRLQSLHISNYNLVNSLTLIMAQRLVRILCIRCKKKSSQPLSDSRSTTYFPHYEAVGCTHCHQGYDGRTGIFELLPITNKIREFLLSGAPLATFHTNLPDEKFIRLWEMGMKKVAHGITSLAEIKRIIAR